MERAPSREHSARDFVPISGELANADLEAAFREQHRVDHAARARTAHRVAAALMAAFCITDLGYHGLGRTGLGLSAARVSWAVFALVYASRVSTMAMREADRWAAVLAFTASGVVLFSTALRPTGFQPHTLTNAAVVMAIYLLLPLRFSAAVACGAAMSLGYLALTAHGGMPLAPFLAMSGGYMMANAIGVTGHGWMARAARSEFLRTRAAEEAHAERLAFLASTSHELRSPLHGIVACAELLAGTSLDEEQRGLVGLIRTSGVAMSGLLEEAVHQVRGGHELPAIDEAAIDLHAFHDDVCAFIRARAASHGVVVSMEREASVPRHVHADGGRLRQVLLNFAENALAHGAKESIVIAMATEPRLADGRLPIALTVRDDGPGVPPELRDAILRPFVQANRSSALRGMGLGLSICDRIARAMDARIEIDDAKEGGACFRFCVPLREATGETERPPLDVPRLDVLLVEDEAVNRRLMSLLLEREGHRVTAATTGERAVELASTNRFDVVLMDLRLPRMDGLEAMRQIAGLPDAPPVLAMSAHAALADHAELLAAGFRAVLPKPVDLGRLRASLAMLSKTPVLLDESRLAPHLSVLGESQVAELLALFVETTAPLMDAIGSAAESGRIADLAALAHRLAGAADSVALSRCSSDASALEHAARSGEPVSAAMLHALRLSYEASCEKARSRLG
jgi:signal transduction histidine kinase/ActR/RegA family two-component response regulator